MTARKRTNLDFQEEQEQQDLPKPKVFEQPLSGSYTNLYIASQFALR